MVFGKKTPLQMMNDDCPEKATGSMNEECPEKVSGSMNDEGRRKERLPAVGIRPRKNANTAKERIGQQRSGREDE